jgi:hypothetical protein
MPMPEATMNEDDLALRRKGDIRRAWKIAAM